MSKPEPSVRVVRMACQSLHKADWQVVFFIVEIRCGHRPALREDHKDLSKSRFFRFERHDHGTSTHSRCHENLVAAKEAGFDVVHVNMKVIGRDLMKHSVYRTNPLLDVLPY